MTKAPKLTPTSYALLGLLARGPRSAYELNGIMQTSLTSIRNRKSCWLTVWSASSGRKSTAGRARSTPSPTRVGKYWKSGCGKRAVRSCEPSRN
jgi:hypothetical protein